MLRLLSKKSFPPTSIDGSLPQRLTSTIVSWQNITGASGSRSKPDRKHSKDGTAAAVGGTDAGNVLPAAAVPGDPMEGVTTSGGIGAATAAAGDGGASRAGSQAPVPPPGSRPLTPQGPPGQLPPGPRGGQVSTPSKYEEGEVSGLAGELSGGGGLDGAQTADDALLESLLMETGGGSGSWQQQLAAAAARRSMDGGGGMQAADDAGMVEEGEAVGLQQFDGDAVYLEDTLMVDGAADGASWALLGGSDADTADVGVLGEGGAAATPAAKLPGAASVTVLLPPALQYKLVVRTSSLELAAVVTVYQDYPLHPPLWEVAAVLNVPKEKGKKGQAQHLPGEVLWLERKVRMLGLIAKRGGGCGSFG